MSKPVRPRRPNGTGTAPRWNDDRQVYEILMSLPNGRRTTLRDPDPLRLEQRRQRFMHSSDAQHMTRVLDDLRATIVADERVVDQLRADLHELADELLDTFLLWLEGRRTG